MKKITVFFAALAVVVSALSVSALQPAHAADLFDDACTAARDDAAQNPEQSAVCKDRSNNDNPLVGPDGLILRVSMIIATIAGVIAVIMVIIGGAGMITSGGDANAVKTARSRVYHALIGLVIIVLAQTIISLVVSRVLG